MHIWYSYIKEEINSDSNKTYVHVKMVRYDLIVKVNF